ncbi:MAG: hypothetical protein HWE13_06220 [Gammaproteobacteria bacterium]|nr:hypothetical protein [Gammaproteobacteria bacterium]
MDILRLNLGQLPDSLFWCQASAQNITDYDELIASIWPAYFLTPSDIDFPEMFSQSERKQYTDNHMIIGIREQATGQLVACMSAVALTLPDPMTETLPDDGWQWAYRQAHYSHQPNALALQQVTLAFNAPSLNLPNVLIKAAKVIAGAKNYERIVVPIRPIAKNRHPELSFEQFIRSVQQKSIVDPWIARHLEEGAKLLNICHQSITIRASITWWNQWLEQPLSNASTQTIPFAIVPLEVDHTMNTAAYIEPNLWAAYSL